MQLQAGDTLGPYVVIGAAGSGGMGEVYKATDTRLNRLVALKVIGAGLAEYPDIRSRFAAEARAVAALNHPHICALYDTGHDLGKDFLVLEYLEGETLAQRLRRGPLTAPEVLGYAIEIAEALDYAHRRGIVHRDLKPSNVLLTRSGGAKLLDFGVAGLRETANCADGVADGATRPIEGTDEPVVLGTLHYFAPERFDGRPADARSDAFAFGVMFFEMITSRKPFDEQNQARLIAAIISKETPSVDHAPDMPPEFQWIVQNCLAKEPDARWQSMGDVAKVLKGIARTTSRPIVSSPRRWSRTLWYAAGIVAAAILTAGILTVRRPPTVLQPVHETVTLSMLPPPGSAFTLTESTVKSAQLGISPDGRSLVFAATTAGQRQLWLRDFSQPDARLLPGTTGASYPFWSPDSKFVGFFADGYLKKVSVSGRPSQPVCKALNARGGAWSFDGRVVFSPDAASALSIVSATGGEPKPLTRLAPDHLAHRWPQVLSDGRLLLFVRSNDPNVRGTYVTSLEGSHDLRLVRLTTASATAASGHLLFVLDGELVAQPLDPMTLQVSGEALPVGLKVSTSSTMSSPVSASDAGVLATWVNAGNLSELVWFDRRGLRLGVAAERDRYVDFRLSPDERRVALARIHPSSNTADLAMLDLGRRFVTALTSSSQTDASPIWSPSGDRLVFRSNRRGLHDLFETTATNSGGERLLHATGLSMYPTDWSPDEGVIVFHALDPVTRNDIWKLDLAKGAAEPLRHTTSEEAQGQLAPGGRFAYTSNESGELQVYVRALDWTGLSMNVSTEGGFDPRWRADGRELFYVSPAGKLMVADVSPDLRQVSPGRPLFDTAIQYTTAPYLSDYVVSRDGSRFLIKVPTEPAGAAPITVTLNWLDRLHATGRNP